MTRLTVNAVLFSAFLVAAVAVPVSAFAQPQRRPQGRTPEAPRVPDGVTAHRDVAYIENGHERQKLDLYVPQSSEPLPVLIWVHGGGWQGGSKDGCPPLRAGYTQQGYAVASIGYRLSGDATFPAQIEDCKAGIRWLRAHAEQYNLDPERFGVWGSSAGGHLVALLGTSGDVKEFDVGPNPDQSSRVQAVCDYYGPTDFHVFVATPRYESHATDSSPEAKLIGGAVSDSPEQVKRVNPITYVSKDDPPFLIVHGDQDGTVPHNQSELLFESLKETGVRVHFHTIHGAGHGGPGFNEPVVADMVREFFERKLKSKQADSGEPEATTSESTASEPAADRRPAAGGGGPRITWQAVVSRQDTDKDGRISKGEFRGPVPLWERLDRDKDGYVTEEEHETVLRQRPGAGRGRE